MLIDGSVLEGGGQILRNAISLAALLRSDIQIQNIRKGRNPPGLKNQHRTGLELAARISNAALSGAENGSTEISFQPGEINVPGNWEADSLTAGSTTLLLQIALPLLLFSQSSAAPSNLILKGGTNATQAPQIDYIKHIFLPFVSKFLGIRAEIDLHTRGYFPRGGGVVSVNVIPPAGKLTSFSLLERGEVKKIRGIAHYGKLPAQVGRLMVEGARRKLKTAGYVGSQTVEISQHRDDSVIGPGSGIVLWAELSSGGTIGGSAVGRKGLDATKVGEQAAEELLKALSEGGCVDEWLQDQIIIFMALADGTSQVGCGTGGLTLHTQTAIWVAQQLTSAKFEVIKEDTGHTIIRCHGIGYCTPPEETSRETIARAVE